MEHLPSYQDAVGQKDWLDLVAPYLPIRDYQRLCLVSRRFYERFSPQLWKDPIRTARAMGLDPGDDFGWYLAFLKRMSAVRRSTAESVATWDYRGFAAGTEDFYSHTTTSSISGSFPNLPARFPNLRCLLLDGHPEIDPTMLQKRVGLGDKNDVSLEALNLLSMVQCQTQIPHKFFTGQWLIGLVYLDLSNMPGSLRPQLEQNSLIPYNLPELRVLKVRGREMDDATAELLLKAFKRRLWSLDLSHNHLTDATLDHLLSETFPSQPHYLLQLRSDAHFGVEGKIVHFAEAGSTTFGSFHFILESEHSATFSSPERYLADAPIYVADVVTAAQEDMIFRNHGQEPIRGDSADDIKCLLTGGMNKPVPDSAFLNHLPICQLRGGITHLHLNELEINSAAIQRLLRSSPGQLEHFECDSPTFRLNYAARPDFLSKATWLSKSARFYGFPGGAYLFRPAFSSNLRVLKMHHSLMTNTPTLVSGSFSTMANLWLAETFFTDRFDLAYPQRYVLDMNPRLHSLTLTKIPRYSTGCVIDRLIEFLRLAAIQEKSIADAIVSTRYRAPAMLKGLRHIRLEFEPDPKQEMRSLEDGEELDADELIAMAAKEFSFFGRDGWRSSTSADSQQTSRTIGKSTPNADAPVADGPGCSKPLLTDAEGEHTEYYGTWNGEGFRIPVWIGPGVRSSDPAVKEYVKNVCDPSLRTDPIPASPCHVVAGVPPGSYIFNTAWDAMLVPSEIRRPTREDLNNMRDVLAAIKKYRLETRAAYASSQREVQQGASSAPRHHFWTGRLEIELKTSQVHSSEYWR